MEHVFICIRLIKIEIIYHVSNSISCGASTQVSLSVLYLESTSVALYIAAIYS